jgi:hypothetical protein
MAGLNPRTEQLHEAFKHQGRLGIELTHVRDPIFQRHGDDGRRRRSERQHASALSLGRRMRHTQRSS